MVQFDEDLLAFYFALARSLPGMGRIGLLGLPCQVGGLPDAYGPLLEKVVAWKNGVVPDGTVQATELCVPLLELFSCHAAFSGKPIEEVFVATGYMISPLRVARLECEQLFFFAERGFRMKMGHQPTQGLTAPATFAGAITLALAEQIFLFLLDSALNEEARLELTSNVMTVDPRTAMALYGRPEQQRINAAFADIARFYGCPCRGHTGLSDAKAPSFEAGAQKATGALITALALGEGSIEAGLLGVDEICSPLQMVLDVELANSLNALLAHQAIDDEACGVEEIAAAVRESGNFLDSELTARRCRTEFFLPKTWSNQLVSGWHSSGAKRDLDLAREWVAAFRSNYTPVAHIQPEEERELLTIVRRAAG
jgi:trimethylamine--corrinoid protein Co-methyltransferase